MSEFQELINKYSKILNVDFSKYFRFPDTFIRINTLKIEPEKVVNNLIERGYKLEKLKFFEFGYRVLNKEKNIAKEVEHALGYIFMQDASSMLVPLILNPNENEIILDLCAAPGAKTTMISQLMNNRGIIIANDVELKRLIALQSNIQKLGCLNVIVIKEDGRFLYRKLKNFFDKVLVDVPCSNSGTFVPEAYKNLNEKFIKSISKLQKSLLASAYYLTKKNGIIVYSTCSLEIEENEANIDWFIKNFKVELEEIKVKGINLIDGITKYENFEFDKEIKKTKRVLEIGQESFYIAKIRKIE